MDVKTGRLPQACRLSQRCLLRSLPPILFRLLPTASHVGFFILSQSGDPSLAGLTPEPVIEHFAQSGGE
jgi:hypothetical protein